MKRYLPLFTLVFIALFSAFALNFATEQSFHAWAHYFMGFFFTQFAMLKLFHPSAFVGGFQKYDLIAKHSRFYAYLYPFIELALGLAYLSFIFPMLVYGVTILVMTISAIGVIKALKAGLDVRCACMGTILDVPLSTVTLTEDLVMGVMALLMLLK